MRGLVLTPDPPLHSSVCRTSSILSRDHPPDKKPKSDKTSVPPAQDLDSTGKPIYLLVSLFPPLAPVMVFPALFPAPNEPWPVRLEKCALCVVLRGELKLSVLLTLTQCSQNAIGCPLFKTQTPSHCRGADSNSAVIQPS